MQQTQLMTTELGTTGLEITRVGFGAWAIGGGGWEFGWGPQDDEESIAAIHRALEQGVNWIDTAAAYGFGRSEESSGARSRACRSARTCSPRPRCSRARPPGRPQPQARLDPARGGRQPRAAGVDAIDLYQIHWPNPDEDVEEGWSALAELKEQGLVRHIGVSNFDVEQLRADPADRPGRDASAAVLADRARRRARAPALRRARGDRRDRLLADGLRPAHRRDDPRADRPTARRRLAQARRPLHRAAALAEPRIVDRLCGCRAPRTRRPAPSPSPGRCATRPSTARSSASAVPTRSIRSSPPPAELS